MANGNLTDIGFQDILGASKYGGDQLSSIVNALTNTLTTGGYFGTEYQKGGTSYGQTPTYGLGESNFSPVGGFDDPSSPLDVGGFGPATLGSRGTGYGATPEYTLENLISSLKSEYDVGGQYYDLSGLDETSSEYKRRGGMQSLLSLLQGLQLPNITRGYGENIADVGTEIGSELQKLQLGAGIGGKGERYGGIGSSGRKLGGGRDKYLADYYGLKDKQFEMQRGLQGELESEFMGNIGSWMQYNSPV